MGDHDDLPIGKVEVQHRRLHKKRQPLEQLDGVIEEIKKLMLRSAEAVIRWKLNRGEPAIAIGKKKNVQTQQQQQQQRHSWRGAGGQLQKKVWDLGGFKRWRRGAHVFPSF
jgi:hypothetical protein